MKTVNRYDVLKLVGIGVAALSFPMLGKAAGTVYAGFYRGATFTNSSGVEMKSGIYTFTNIANAAESATRGSVTSFGNYQKMAFDGSIYYSFWRKSTSSGPGLYNTIAAAIVSSNADSGVTYTFTNWHGIGYCNSYFYGLYNGTGLSGPGLYRFTDPTDPEGAAVRLFAPQTFPSNTWSDMDFDGTRWLFVKTAVEGNPGIYQFDPLTTNFIPISGAETYTNWDGLGVYVSPPPPPPSTNVPLLHKKIYVILLGGQSNGLGWGYRQYLLTCTNSPASSTNDPADFALAYPQTDVDLFNGFEGAVPLNTLLPLQSGSANTEVSNPTTNKAAQYPSETTAPVNRFGPELSMGRTIRDLIRIPNSKVAVIKHCVGGTSLYADWRPDGTTNSATDGPKYQNFQTTVWNGLAALRTQYPDHDVEIIGMGWVQGEADSGATQNTNYYSNLTNFVTDLRATFSTNMVFALAKLSTNQSSGAGYATIRAAQQALADTVPRVVATETLGSNYLTADGYCEGKVHYLSPSLVRIGRDLGNAIVSKSGLDSDADGLPDAWENSYAPGAAGLGVSPSADWDHDGLTDIQEFQLGTDPANPSDNLTLTKTASRISWSAKKDIRYQMLTSTNLISWADFGDPVLLRGSNSTFDVDFSSYMTTNRSGYFRLQVR